MENKTYQGKIEEVHAKEGYEHPTEPNVQEYIHRIWFASPQDKDQFMQILCPV